MALTGSQHKQAQDALVHNDQCPHLSIGLLGGLSILSRETSLHLDQPRLQRLLVYLILHRRQPCVRQQIAFDLWPDTGEEQALKNLRTLLVRLRQALPDLDGFVATCPTTLQWRPDGLYTLDVADFEAACATGTHLMRAEAGSATIDALVHAVALYAGDLVPGWFDEWVLLERERLRQLYVTALEQLVTQLEKAGRPHDALAYANELLRTDPLHENVYGQVIHLHLAMGDRASALRAYHTCATALREELGVDPGPATQALYLRVLTLDDAAKVQPLPAGSMTPDTPAAASLVGRQLEWTALRRAWQQAAQGKAQVLLLGGEAGIGKTRLAEELSAWAARQGIATTFARCYASGGSLAYAPVTEWLRSAALRGSVEALDGIWRSEVARLLPDLVARRPDLPAPGPMTEAWQRQRFFQALSCAVLGTCGANGSELAPIGNSMSSGITRPLLLVLDDMQWCDHDTLDWLQFFIQANVNAPILLLGTVRVEEAIENHALATFQLVLGRYDLLHQLLLPRLDAAETASLAAELLGYALTPAQTARLFQDTEGNPLFIVEMVRAGALDKEITTSSGNIPDSSVMSVLPPKARAVIRRRLALLSPVAHELAQSAAVIGRKFSFAVLARASGMAEADVVHGLDELWRRQIVREHGIDGYDFSHDKLRTEAYAEIGPARRRMAHLCTAEAIEAIYADNPTDFSPQLADHYARAGRIQQAVAYDRQAATAAERIYAHQDAIRYLQHALELMALAQNSSDNAIVSIYEQLGDIYELGTQHDAAHSAYRDALAATRTDDRLSQARLQRKIGKTLEGMRADYEQVVATYAVAMKLLGEPDANASDEWWEERCQLQLELLLLQYWWGYKDQMAVEIVHVRHLIEKHGTPFQRASLFVNLSRHFQQQGRYAPSDIALEYARAGLNALAAVTSPELRAPYHFALGFNLLWHGDLEEAERELNAALTLSTQARDVTLQARCLAYAAATYRLAHRLEETEAYAERGNVVAEAAHMQEYIGANLSNLAWVAWRRGDAVMAEQLVQAALAAWQQYALPYPFYWQGLLPVLAISLERNNVKQAVDYAQLLVDPKQLRLPAPIEALLVEAIDAWNACAPDGVSQALTAALSHAFERGYL